MSWTEVAIACVASFLLTVVFTRLLIPFLKSRQLGKTIREDGPAHQAKAGTPTMGGLGMLAAVGLVGTVVASRTIMVRVQGTPRQDPEWPYFVAREIVTFGMPLIAMFLFAGLGLLDDWQGLARKGRAREMGVGLSARRMLLLQLAIALSLAMLSMAVFYKHAVVVGESDISRWSDLDIGLAILSPTMLLYLGAIIVPAVGVVNGVNLADGLDGLCSGLLAIAFSALGLTLLIGQSNESLPSISFVAAAACLGFLVFNRHPAQVFMGNVASLGLGALMVVLSLWSLPASLLIAAVFVVEVVSDIIQIVYFKRTGGKRFFLMAPIHHHFEKLGWPETKVVTVFWSCGLVAALAGVGLAALLARS